MHHPPEPHYSFTIPSIHDDTTLDCRIYHPQEVWRPQSHDNGNSRPWQKRGIIMAHPYAPLGGSYDDRVVGIVVEEYLALGYVVGTFNFRGAHGSKGRTSWSGKPEVNDYISFAGLFIHYLSYLRPQPSLYSTFSPDQFQQLQNGPTRGQSADVPTIILGGYSHGSLILQHLPPVPSILHPFSAPINGSSASEILLRARKLSAQSNLEWMNLARDHERQKRAGHEAKISIAMGGEETNPQKRRSSRETRRSIEGKRSGDLGERLRSLDLKRRKRDIPPPPLPEIDGATITIGMPTVRYLLISPLTTPTSLFVAPGLVHRSWHRSSEQQEVIGRYRSLVVYGDQDMFSSAKKVSSWVEKLGREPESELSHVEVAGAGHFWVEDGVEEKLRSALREWGAQAQ